METDEEPRPNSEETGLPEEDFSVYVAPKTAPVVPSDQPILRLEPNLALVSFPVGILLLLDFCVYVRAKAPEALTSTTALHYTSQIPFLIAAVLTILLLAAPFYFSPSYFAELYEDRLVVRRGAREWATPLEDIVKVDLMPCAVAGAGDLSVLRILASFGYFGRFSALGSTAGYASDAPKRPSNVLHAYLVRTTFDTAFWIPPFVGHEEFATAVLQQQTRVLARRPPVVRGTIHESEI